jgi:hypothetical protein
MQPTNSNQFTEKAWEAIVRTPEVAKQFQHQQIENENWKRRSPRQSYAENSMKETRFMLGLKMNNWSSSV